MNKFQKHSKSQAVCNTPDVLWSLTLSASSYNPSIYSYKSLSLFSMP